MDWLRHPSCVYITVHCITKDADTSEITFLALYLCSDRRNSGDLLPTCPAQDNFIFVYIFNSRNTSRYNMYTNPLILYLVLCLLGVTDLN